MPTTHRAAPARLCRLAALCAVCAGLLPAQRASVSASLQVQVRPEAAVAREASDRVRVKIRLRGGAQAAVWSAAACVAPAADAYRIVQSGTFSIPLAGAADARVCLASSDGELTFELAPPR